MTDPFSIAAGVAALVALAGTTSKTFYQFFRSIHNAPAAARDLATGLYTLNIALSQLQQSLLDPKFVRVSDDEQVTAIEDCLASCTAAFDTIRARIEASGFASDDQTFDKRWWEAVKASFNEEQMQGCLNRIEREKTTLIVILNVFSTRLEARIMEHVLETKALAQKTNRRLKDIHVFCQWIVGANAATSKTLSAVPSEDIQTTAFPLSSAYDSSEMKRLLQSSGSTLSLTLGDMDEDSVTAICQPEAQSEVPLKRIVSTIESGRPPKDSEGFFRSKAHTVPFSLEGLDETVSALKSLADHRSLSQSIPKFKERELFLKSLQPPRGMSIIPTLMMIPSPTMLLRMMEKAAQLSTDIHDDLQYLERSYTMLSKHWIDETADEWVPPLLRNASHTIAEYLRWANKIMWHDKLSKKGLHRDLKSLIRAEPNEAERKRLKKLMVTAVETVRDAQRTLASTKTYEMQRQQLLQQEQITKQLQLLIDQQKNIEQPQEQNGRVSKKRSPSALSEIEHMNNGEDTTAGEDPPVRHNVQANEGDSNAAENEEPSGKQHLVKGNITNEIEAACEKL